MTFAIRVTLMIANWTEATLRRINRIESQKYFHYEKESGKSGIKIASQDEFFETIEADKNNLKQKTGNWVKGVYLRSFFE